MYFQRFEVTCASFRPLTSYVHTYGALLPWLHNFLIMLDPPKYMLPIRVSELLQGSKGETFTQCLKRAWLQEATEKAQASLAFSSFSSSLRGPVQRGEGKDEDAGGGKMKMVTSPPPPPCPGYANGAACATGTRIEDRW